LSELAALPPVRFRVERDEHARAVQAIRGREMAAMGLLPLLAWFAVLSALATAIESVGIGRTNPFAFVALVGPAAFLGAAWWRSRRTGVLQWSFSDGGVVIDGRPRPLRIRWDAVREAEETAEFFLLRLEAMGCYVPKRALAGCEGQIRALLLDRLGDRARVGPISPE
jgi:hypothetical protein